MTNSILTWLVLIFKKNPPHHRVNEMTQKHISWSSFMEKVTLPVMSIEAYEELTSRFELYSQIKEGMNDIASDNTRPFCKSDIPVKQKNQSSADYHTGCRKQ